MTLWEAPWTRYYRTAAPCARQRYKAGQDHSFYLHAPRIFLVVDSGCHSYLDNNNNNNNTEKMVYFGPSRGCIQCRRRKIKCDLNTPACRTCVRRNEFCSGPRFYFRKPQNPQALPAAAWSAVSESDTLGFELVPMAPEKDPVDFLWASQMASVPACPPGGQFGNARIGVIPIEPVVLDLLQFWQTKSLQLYMPNATFSLPRRAFDLSLQALSDDIQAYGMIASFASYHSMLTGSLESKMIQAQSYGRAVTALRNYLGTPMVPFRLLGGTNMLIAAEFAAKNFAAAYHHTKFLVPILEIKMGMVTPGLLRLRHTSMVLELERATATFSRPLMDISRWTLHDQEFGPWHPMPSLAEEADTIDVDAIGDMRLIKLFKRVRHLDALLHCSWASDTISQGDAYQISWMCLDLEAQLLNYAIVAHAKGHSHFVWNQRAAAALAALFLLRLRTRMEHAGWLDRRTPQTILERSWAQGPRLLKHITTLMEQSSDAALSLIPNGLDSDLRLRLWILYIGSIIEDTADFGQKRPAYCSYTLSQYVVALGLDEGALQQRFEAILVLRKMDIGLLGPRWLTPELRTWGFPNWNGEVASFRESMVPSNEPD